MKSEGSAKNLPVGPAADALQAFFKLVESPAALCDVQLNLLSANQAFETLCGVEETSGQLLCELLQSAAGAVPPDGASREVTVKCPKGQDVTLTLSRRGSAVAVLARRLSEAAEGVSLAVAASALQEQARIEQALLELGRQVAGATSEEELVAAVARGVKGLFPGRSSCVRITDQRTSALTSMYAEGRLREGARDVIAIRHSAAEKTHLLTHLLPPDKVSITDDEVPLMFHGTGKSICAPLVASGQLFGAINIEYPEGPQFDLESDDRVLIQLANQVAVGVRNAKLIDELTFVRKYLEELLEHANALILVANRERRIVVFNKALSTLTDLSKHEVLGQDLLNFVPDGERMRVMRIIAASLRGEPVSNFETRVVGKDGREVRVSFATSTVLTATGEVEGVIAIGQDLTKMRELERRIIHAEKLASLGQFAASVVHEINNPMTAVAAYTDALLTRSMGRATDSSEVEKLRKILDNCERVLRFTRDLVSYARPAQDKPEEVDLHRVIDTAIGFCDHVVHKHGVHIEREYGELPKLHAVKGNLVQVFVNLVTNACQATQPGGVVTLKTRREGSHAVVRVKDTGYGIEPKHLDRIFEPFFTTKPDGKGTGLGLSIVQGIVESHGGGISVESTVGMGTTFLVRLPFGE
ncbi:MAG: PAS domain S-box protein [Myxococcales bacterium]|nr:PAS domain S-box protein [Myxococcales bacterium]